MARTVTAWVTTNDGKVVRYTPERGFIPTGTMTMPYRRNADGVGPFDAILPGASTFRFPLNGSTCEAGADDAYFVTTTKLSIGRQELGADNVWRCVDWVPCVRTVVVSY